MVRLLETALASPIFWGVFAIVALAIAFTGKISMTASAWLLWSACAMAVFGIYRAEVLLRLDTPLRLLILGCIVCGLSAGTLVLQRWLISPKRETITPHTSPALALGSGPGEIVSGTKASVGVMVTPSQEGFPKELSFTTEGNGIQEFRFDTRPRKVLFESPMSVVQENELPREIEIGGTKVTIVRFTKLGFTLDDHHRPISGKATLLEGGGNGNHIPARQGKGPHISEASSPPRLDVGLVLGADKRIGIDAIADCTNPAYVCVSSSDMKSKTLTFDVGQKGWGRIIFRLTNKGGAKLVNSRIHIESPNPISIEYAPSPDPDRLPRNVLEISADDIFPFALSQAAYAVPLDVTPSPRIDTFQITISIFGDNMTAHKQTATFSIRR